MAIILRFYTLLILAIAETVGVFTKSYWVLGGDVNGAMYRGLQIAV